MARNLSNIVLFGIILILMTASASYAAADETADLKITSVAMDPEVPRENEPADVLITVENNGEFGTNFNLKATVLIMPYNAQDEQEIPVGHIGAGQAIDVPLDDFNFKPSGTWHVTLEAVPEIEELAPEDNDYETTFEVLPPFECVDSDGADEWTLGNVLDNGDEVDYDYCINDSAVREYVCEQGQFRPRKTYEDIKCSSGICQEGKCIPAKDYYISYFSISPGGMAEVSYPFSISFYVQGINSRATDPEPRFTLNYRLEDPEGVVKLSDSITGTGSWNRITTGNITAEEAGQWKFTADVVSENYPDPNEGNNHFEKVINVTPAYECVDSDGSEGYFNAGFVTDFGTTYNDVCADDKTVEEFFCSEEAIPGFRPSVASARRGCRYRCEEGACVEMSDIRLSNLKLIPEKPQVGDEGHVSFELRSVGHSTNYTLSYRLESPSGKVQERTVRENEKIGVVSYSGVHLQEFEFDEVGNWTLTVAAESLILDDVNPGDDVIDYTFYVDYSCKDTDVGKYLFLKGQTSDKGETYTDACVDGNTLREYYCQKTLPRYTLVYQDITCEDGCSEGRCLLSAHPQKGHNKKDKSMYGKREAFLISDESWEAVLSVVPMTVWWEAAGGGEYEEDDDNEGEEGEDKEEKRSGKRRAKDKKEDSVLKKYPLLVYHGEDGGFDADSILYFLRQYRPTKLSIIGEVPAELLDIIVAGAPFGGGIPPERLSTVSYEDYLDYWKRFDTVVYLKHDYDLGLIASAYASLLNAPLIIKGSGMDTPEILEGRKVIGVGACPEGLTCSEYYSTKEELQAKYLELTDTDKFILVNPEDLNIRSVEEFSPSRSPSPVWNIYQGPSLLAPVLAAAKKELIISTRDQYHEDVIRFLQSKYQELGKYPEYLTIVATPEGIDMSKDGHVWKEKVYQDVVDSLYGNTDDDKFFQETKVGRIFSLTSSDVSAYMARDIFLEDIPQTDNYAILYQNSFLEHKMHAVTLDKLFTAAGFNRQSIYLNATTTTFRDVPNAMNGKFYINYLDHGGPFGWSGGINTYSIRENDIWLAPSAIMGEACSTCAYEGYSRMDWPREKLFCTNLLRRGALGYVGAVDVAGLYPGLSKAFGEAIVKGADLGEAMRTAKMGMRVSQVFNSPKQIDDPWYVLLGDPTITFVPEPEPLGLDEVEFTTEQVSDLNWTITVRMPETRAVDTFDLGEEYLGDWKYNIFEGRAGPEYYFRTFYKPEEEKGNYRSMVGSFVDLPTDQEIGEVYQVERITGDESFVITPSTISTPYPCVSYYTHLYPNRKCWSGYEYPEGSSEGANTQAVFEPDLSENRHYLAFHRYRWNSMEDLADGLIPEHEFKVYVTLVPRE